eukprot:scaffold8473_cov141-Isochrysis_galbana.AAC.4
MEQTPADARRSFGLWADRHGHGNSTVAETPARCAIRRQISSDNKVSQRATTFICLNQCLFFYG